jgi:hypothetical protein
MIKLPTPIQLENSALMDWNYLGDGIFERDGVMGFFTDDGFKKE